MYDILEVLFFHKPGCDKVKSIAKLQEACLPNFEVEELEFSDVNGVDRSRQFVRIIASGLEPFSSADAMEAAIREWAPADEYPWKRVGVVPVGETKTIIA